MSDRFWGWCPASDRESMVYDLSRYGYRGCANAVVEKCFVVISFRQSDIPPHLMNDVAYRLYLRFIEDSGGFVPSDIANKLFPVRAEEMVEAGDMILDGIEQINKYFASVMKMNEYQDDIQYMMELGLGVLDYFIGCLSHMDDMLGDRARVRINELKFKRSYMLSMKMHIGS